MWYRSPSPWLSTYVRATRPFICCTEQRPSATSASVGLRTPPSGSSIRWMFGKFIDAKTNGSPAPSTSAPSFSAAKPLSGAALQEVP